MRRSGLPVTVGIGRSRRDQGRGRLLERRAVCSSAEFVVGDLGDLVELAVGLTDGQERRRGDDTDHVVGVALQLLSGRLGCGRDRDHDAGRPLLADCRGRVVHGEARGQAVIDQDHHLAVDRRLVQLTAVGVVAAL